MSGATTRVAWAEANRAYLGASLRRLTALLEGDEPPDAPDVVAPGEAALAPPALVRTVELFGLSPFERDVLLLVAGVELDGDLARACAIRPEAHGGDPTFALALATLPEPHWSALTASAPLRYWRLLELGAGSGLTSRALKIDERILHHLLGISPLDERLHGLVDPVEAGGAVSDTHRGLALQVLESWTEPNGDGWPVLELLGPDAGGKLAVASLACAELGAALMRMDAADLPDDDGARDLVALLWDREAYLTGAVLLVECEDVEPERVDRVTSLVRRLRAPVLVASREPLPVRRSTVVHLEVGRPSGSEARGLWQAELGPAWSALNGEGDGVLGHFTLGLDGIRCVSAQVRHRSAGREAEVGSMIWRACRSQSRPRLDGLARRVEPQASWEDLVLPAPQLAVLRELALHLRQRATVYERWGFERRSARGLGFSALFAGGSGTGKTMAGEVLARHLDLDLYRIDLSQVVSKYVGETEKKLGRVFDGAEDGGVVLLFDEADALFGKRSEVKDSHDRYANIEVSYLLQRMEAYRGLAILTTNQKNALDQAFLRRLRFIVHFPFPDESLREEIWRRVFPPDTPVAELDFGRLARLDLTGGNIRNIAMGAAFLAAGAGEAVGMGHLVAAARSEYTKLGKPIAEGELRRLVGAGSPA